MPDAVVFESQSEALGGWSAARASDSKRHRQGPPSWELLHSTSRPPWQLYSRHATAPSDSAPAKKRRVEAGDANLWRLGQCQDAAAGRSDAELLLLVVHQPEAEHSWMRATGSFSSNYIRSFVVSTGSKNQRFRCRSFVLHAWQQVEPVSEWRPETLQPYCE